jgi:hypothetical protein
MRGIVLGLALGLVAGCRQDEGERCNPAQYSDTANQGNCSAGLSCVYPTANNCGIAYCCKVDSSGKIIDSSPTCQPDPSLPSVCALDLGVSDGSAGN